MTSSSLTSSSPSSSMEVLSVGTWNIGQGLNNKLLPILHECVERKLDVIGLQEIGEVECDPALISAAGYRAYCCPAAHSGVAILIAKAYCKYIRAVHRREQDGRLMAVELDIQGDKMIIINAYLPSGLDFRSYADEKGDDGQQQQTTDKKLVVAEEVYATILEWSRDRNKKVIVIGDMNETCLPLDRSRMTHATKQGRFIRQLTTNGFADVYRTLNPTTPGFTHATTSASTLVIGCRIESRLDYLFIRGWSADTIQQCEISDPSSLSHHSLLYMRMGIAITVQPEYKKVKWSVPNLRKATDEMKHKLVEVVEAEWDEMRGWMERQLASGDREKLDLVTNRLSSIVFKAACSILGMTGQKKKWKHSALDKVKQQRKHLIALRSIAKQIHLGTSNCSFHSYEWKLKLKQCRRRLSDTGPIPDPLQDYIDFDNQCQQLLNIIARNINRIKLQIAAVSKSKIDANPTAAVHRMMRIGDAQQLDNVVTEDNQLVTDPKQMKQLLHDGFASVFDFNLPLPLTQADAADAGLVTTATAEDKATAAASPPPACPIWYHQVYSRRREEIKAEWYDGLMSSVSAEEVRDTCASCPYYVAPGHDGVNAGVWRVLAEGSPLVCDMLASLFSSCLDAGMMPELGKKSIIVPIPKKATAPMKMNNIRPISLQAALTKLLSKLLATRLANILAAHPILHPAQEAFIKNGAITNCVDSWLDIWEMSKQNKMDCFNLFYDIKAAYDSVQHMDLLRSLHRLHLPHSFIVLMADSLTGLTSSVRTIYGLTEEFLVRRSVRQGDPLAPLLYVIFMDALHAGMECNPLARHKDCRDGFVFKPVVEKRSSSSHGEEKEPEVKAAGTATSVASKGFADDTVAMSSTLMGLSRINDWVHAWIEFNHLQLHPDKTKLVGRHSNECMLNTEVQLSVAGKVLEPAPLTESITYLGVTTNMEMQWEGTVSKVNRMIGLFTSRIQAYRLTVAQAVMVINVYLIPKLDLSLRYVNVPDRQIHKWDQALSRCINVCAGMRRSIGKYAVSVLTGLMLPSQYEAIAKISECFLRLNNNSLSSTTGQMRWKQMEGSTSDTATHSSYNRLVRVRKLVGDMRWEMRQLPRSRGVRRREEEKGEGGGEWKCEELVPSAVKRVELKLNGMKHSLVYDYIGEWGTRLAKQDVIVYTDGSSSNPTNEESESGSSWALCFTDDWLRHHHSSLPMEEQQITMQSHLIHACVAGGKIDVVVSSGIFMAELQAIYRALQAVPITYNVTIISDSQASIKAIAAYRSAVSNRKRMRMIGRPLLCLIVRLILAHEARGSRVLMQHIRSHTSSTTHTRSQHQAGNSCADRAAAFCRSASEHQIAHLSSAMGAGVCVSTKQMDMRQGEKFLYAEQEMRLVTADVRKTLALQAKKLAMQSWSLESSHPAYAVKEVMDLCKHIWDEDGTDRKRIRFILSLVTDSAQYYKPKNIDTRKVEVLEYKCSRCDADEIANVEHVLSCDGYKRERERVKVKVKDQLKQLRRIQEWLLIDGADQDLGSLLCRLFFDEMESRVRVRLMFGGFSDAECATALKRIQVTEKKESWLPVLMQVRRLLFEHVYAIYVALC